MLRKRAFVLDDDPERIAWFKKQLEGTHDVDCASTATLAIWHLKTFPTRYDWIFLDHDLGVNAQTGLEVARWLGDHLTLQGQARIIVHSCNPDGARAMVEALNGRAIHMPYPMLMKNAQVDA